MKTLNIRIITQNGSIYELHHEGDKLFLRKGIVLSGEVVKIHQPIEVGGVLHVDYIREGLFTTPDSDPMFLRTSPITDIMIR